MKTSRASQATNDSRANPIDERITNWLIAVVAVAILAMLLWG